MAIKTGAVYAMTKGAPATLPVAVFSHIAARAAVTKLIVRLPPSLNG